MSQTQIRQCRCPDEKIYMGIFENEPITIICKECIKDPAITNSGKFTEIKTGKEVKI